MQQSSLFPKKSTSVHGTSTVSSTKRFGTLRQIFNSSDLRRTLPWLGLSAAASNTLALALPLTILQIMDRVVINKSVETLVLLVIGVVLALILEESLKSASNVTTSWLGARFEHNASVAALTRLMKVPLQRYQQEEPGTHSDRIMASAKVADFYSGRALLVLFDFPFAAIFLILIFIIGGWLVLVPLTLLALFTMLIYFSGNWMKRQVEQRNKIDDRRLGFLNEVLAGIHSVKTLMMESIMLRRYEQLMQTSSEIGESLGRGNAISVNIGTLFRQLMIVSVIFAGSWIVMAGGMTPGGLSACMLLSIRALQPLTRGLAVWMRYQSFVVANARLNDVMKLPYESDVGKLPIGLLGSGLELRDVSVSFGSDKKLFSNLNLCIKANDFIAIKGESGSGKTSLLSLMNGLLRPDSGQVLVDGRPIDSFAPDSVYQQIALLPQVGAIVSGNVLENLTMFDASLNQEALRIANRLGLDQVVSNMKLGYETPLGDGVDDTLPAGLRQIIIIVRALVRKPALILFDEANTSLDMRGDQLLRDYLADLKGQCAVVLVTPRPSLVSLADRVFLLSEGQLVESIPQQPQLVQSTSPEISIIPERPCAVDDISIVLRRQFSQESDLSICLHPLLTALNWGGHARDLVEAMPHLVPKLDLSNLCSIMGNLGLLPKHLQGNLAGLDARLLPCLFVPYDQEAQVILQRLPSGRLRVFDSATRSEAEIDPKPIDGQIYLFQSEDLKEKALQDQKSWIGNLLWRLRKHIALIFALSLLGACLSLTVPLFVRTMYDTVLPTGDHVMSGYMVLGVLIVIGIDALLRNLKGRILAFIGARADYVLGSSMFKRIINLPASASQGASISHQVGRIRNIERLRDFFLGPMSLLAFELPAAAVLLVAIGIINPYVLIVLLVAGGAFALLGYVSRKSLGRSTGKAARLQTQRWEFLNEALTDMRTIRMAGAARTWIERFRDMTGKSVVANFQEQRLQGRTASISKIIGSITGLVALATSAYLAISGHITSGTMIATMMILWRITGPLESIFMASTSLLQMKSNIAQTDRLMRLKGEAETGVRQTLKGVPQGAIRFLRVSFRYTNNADPALLGITFTAEPGKLLVLTGSVGSGKSSILELIERTYVPQAGTIRLDNVDIRQLTVKDLRSTISYMPQHCELFYGSVAQNLLLVHPAASDEEIRWAIEMAGLTADIAALPEGLNTRISNAKSEQLPHGFRQRLSLARTMLKPAAVILLDEPGSGMDAVGEEALLKCVKWMRGRATIIMVSHRPGHMKLADNIILLRQGNVVASGAYESIKEKIMSEML